MTEFEPGARFQSTVCTTEVIVVVGRGEAELCCGGAAMVRAGSQPAIDPAGGVEPSPDAANGTLLGKRYGDPAETIELLCTKAGAGSLSLADTPLTVKTAKPLPASD